MTATDSGRRMSWWRGIIVMSVALGFLAGASVRATTTVGGGTVVGQVAFSGGGVPPMNTPCRPVGFSFTMTAAVTMANAAGAQYADVFGVSAASEFTQVPLTGSGSSTCENASVGGGNLSLGAIHVTNKVTQGTLDCTSMGGKYVRTGTDLTAVLAGECVINAQATGKVAVVVRGELIPQGPTGTGVTSPITAAAFTGTFQVVPAG